MAYQAGIQSATYPRHSRNWLATAGLLLVAAVAVRFAAHYALPYFGFDPQLFKDFWPHRIRLILHISGGLLTLLVGPFQFWTGLRRRAMHIHKLTGKLYLFGVVIGAVGGYSLAVYSKPEGFAFALIIMSTAWVLTTAVAYTAILRGLVNLHQEWMVRSYIVTFAFVNIRLLIDNLPFITAHLGGTLPERVINVVWISWLLPLAAYELILQARKILASKTAARVAPVFGD